LDDAELCGAGRDVGIAKDRHPRHAWHHLLEQLQPFSAQAVFGRNESGGIAAWPRQTIYEAGADRINNVCEHDRHGAGRPQQRPHLARAANRQNHIRRERGQFCRVFANVVGIS
jgi:hypothetical protein